MGNGIQLEMNFDGAMGNRFKEKLDNGNFQVLVEVNAPPAETPLVRTCHAPYPRKAQYTAASRLAKISAGSWMR